MVKWGQKTGKYRRGLEEIADIIDKNTEGNNVFLVIS